MAWKIEYDSSVLEEMRTLSRETRRRIVDYFDERIAPSSNPRNYGKPLAYSFPGFWRYRIGACRAICRIENEKLVVLIVRVAHRREVYKKPLS